MSKWNISKNKYHIVECRLNREFDYVAIWLKWWYLWGKKDHIIFNFHEFNGAYAAIISCC